MQRITLLVRGIVAMALAATFVAAAHAQAPGPAPEKKDIKLGVGGASALYYLPLALTDRLGFFKEQGLNVEIDDFKGGSQSLAALVGGSVDIVAGAYEHTLRMQAKGQDIVAVVELGRYPGIVLAAKKDRSDKIRAIGDLKGAKIGVTAPGSSTNMVAQFLMVKNGLKPDDASFVGVGAGPSAVAAIEKGEIDALANVDPVIAKLEASGQIVLLADTRTSAGCDQVFGGTMSAAVAYLRRDFLARNPHTVAALVKAFYRTLQWMQTASPEQIADTVPKEYWLGDKALYLAALKANLQVYSRDGMVSEGSRTRSLAFLRQLDKEMAAADVDPAKTWDGQFVAAAQAAR